jgi:O-acetyl-ADP-ribose deacetylase (regulator of RNase III)
LCAFKHFEHIPHVNLPDAMKYTLYDRCKEANLRLLTTEYPEIPPQEVHYKLISGDLLVFKAELIAHIADCTSYHPLGLAGQIALHLGTNSHSNRLPDTRNPLLCRVHTQATPGTISVEWSRNAGVWVAHLYAQKDCCLPNRKEDASMRMMWFKGCLVLLGNYVREHKLASVALPFGIGCGIAGGEWTRYSSAINMWAEENADAFVVYVVTRAD